MVSVLSTIDSANESVQVTRKIRTDNKWSDVLVKQPKTIDRYNKFMIGVDRSDQLLSTNNVMRKCMRWWKALFFHLVDKAVVNSFILFRLHAQAHPEIEQVQRPASYTFVEFKEEIVRQIVVLLTLTYPLYLLESLQQTSMTRITCQHLVRILRGSTVLSATKMRKWRGRCLPIVVPSVYQSREPSVSSCNSKQELF